jgi:hypothetical protein
MTGRIALLRGSTKISSDDGGEMLGIRVEANSGQNIVLAAGYSYAYLDSPNTTSSTTYKTQIGNQVTGASESITAQFGSTTGSIVLLEIGA